MMYEVRMYKEGVDSEDGPILTVKATKSLVTAAMSYSLLVEEFTQRKGFFISIFQVVKKGPNKSERRLLCYEDRNVLNPSSWYVMLNTPDTGIR